MKYKIEYAIAAMLLSIVPLQCFANYAHLNANNFDYIRKMLGGLIDQSMSFNDLLYSPKSTAFPDSVQKIAKSTQI
ncbi:hypothetical protein [Pseudanabaena sp. 'Roaring Creek']|uniref:hypothetical protein n=1 Tax=Pseudanabaena sp. 'Roaring Creek' TaxID=1681830 RepID=UPI0006D83CB5|nr:hypothetical protein [Pseudanabaena sp. 'Roaring Creek']